jgi:hypothetical protein
VQGETVVFGRGWFHDGIGGGVDVARGRTGTLTGNGVYASVDLYIGVGGRATVSEGGTDSEGTTALTTK